MLASNKNKLIQMLGEAFNELALEGGHEVGRISDIRLERPKSSDHGDIACNIALQMSKS